MLFLYGLEKLGALKNDLKELGAVFNGSLIWFESLRDTLGCDWFETIWTWEVYLMARGIHMMSERMEMRLGHFAVYH